MAKGKNQRGRTGNAHSARRAKKKATRPAPGPATEGRAWEQGTEILPIQSELIDYSKPIPGTYLITGPRAQRGYRLSKFCMSFMDPKNRAAFKADQEKYMRDFGLSSYEQDLVRTQNWNGMLRYGTSAFMLFKLAGTLGVGQNKMGALMRGQTFEEFLATRNVKEAR